MGCGATKPQQVAQPQPGYYPPPAGGPPPGYYGPPPAAAGAYPSYGPPQAAYPSYGPAPYPAPSYGPPPGAYPQQQMYHQQPQQQGLGVGGTMAVAGLAAGAGVLGGIVIADAMDGEMDMF
mmetsp:Transcript_31151/g.69249  ORF Transcript_31151/g.69249 Transcript_31151/m.69249 type:complete len:121 (+) Transcript_31151:188-550(+)|eukprot:CAMPEP_0202892444 /NCGR_PEP_ID=MMETSP1392-20130828/2169_1 /ASSEMBLY_ACC=CAM_ASM_000868 /TAXON_ID=225041 /ORGANISM="Chlamydomonas chlamydogama, Strain SAG 11-48b" /LENGTH=120 /DNA_ID=CAMNT_0049576395 /DNA_START=188 /DNA_END=550 /DNA_ORIENTATION=-